MTDTIKTVVDVRTIEPRHRHPLIFNTFDSLAKGGTFQLVNDHDPLPLKYQFEAELTGQFNWQYIEHGPEVWRVNISKTV